MSYIQEREKKQRDIAPPREPALVPVRVKKVFGMPGYYGQDEYKMLAKADIQNPAAWLEGVDRVRRNLANEIALLKSTAPEVKARVASWRLLPLRTVEEGARAQAEVKAAKAGVKQAARDAKNQKTIDFYRARFASLTKEETSGRKKAEFSYRLEGTFEQALRKMREIHGLHWKEVSMEKLRPIARQLDPTGAFGRAMRYTAIATSTREPWFGAASFAAFANGGGGGGWCRTGGEARARREPSRVTPAQAKDRCARRAREEVRIAMNENEKREEKIAWGAHAAPQHPGRSCGGRWLRAIAAAAILILPSCTPAMLSAADLIGRSAARVLGWCENAPGAEPSRLAQARKAVDEKDYITAAMLLHQAVNDLRAAGTEPPPDIAGSQMLLGALAAEAIQNGMRALSGTSTAAASAASAPANAGSGGSKP
jgi:hypothetical protein